MGEQTDFHMLPQLIGDTPVHVVGIGAVGTRLVDILDTKGVRHIHAWDDGLVEEHNLRNQRFPKSTIGQSKPDAIRAWCMGMRTGSDQRITSHRDRIRAGDTLSGIVLSAVDKMSQRQMVFEAACRGKAIFFGDVRVGPDGAKVYGLWPENEQHRHRYMTAPHMHTDQDGALEGACKTDFPVPEILDIACGHLITRLADWLAVMRGSDAPYMNFYAFGLRPVFRFAYEFWDKDQ